MGFIAEFTVVSPIIRETAEAVPEMEFHTEDLQLVDAEHTNFIFWVDGGDFGQLEAALARDSTIDEFALLTEVGERRLYRTTLTQDGAAYLTYPDASDLDIVFLNVTTTHEGSHFRARIPSRDALQAYRDACRDKGLTFHLERVYRGGPNDTSGRYGLTDRQYEALVLAYKRGYFGAERDTTLETIASDLGISRQALAARLRRGHERLIANTLV